jgi:hypothetical protein
MMRRALMDLTMFTELLIILGSVAASVLSLGSLLLCERQRTREELGRLLPLARRVADALGAGAPTQIAAWGHGAWEIVLERGDMSIVARLHRDQQLQIELHTTHTISPHGATIHALTDWHDTPLDLAPHAPLTGQAAGYVISPAADEPAVSVALREALASWRYAPVYITTYQLRAGAQISDEADALAFIDDCAALASAR